MSLKRVLAIASSLTLGSLFVGGMAAVAVAAPTPTIYVSQKHCSNVGPGTQNSPYCTVQEGVNAVTAGGTVSIAKGTYSEQVSVGSGKNNVMLSGNGKNTVIAAPATMTSPKSIVTVSGATGVTLQHMTVSGPGSGGCDSLEYGIRIDTAGQATINDVRVTKVEDTPFSGCQNGVGIQVGRSADSTTGSATIENSQVDSYQKNGITVSNTGSSATITNTKVTGAGPTDVIAQNGIQVSSGATATISNDIVRDNVYTPQSVTATGILLFNSGTVSLSNNTVKSNDTDIYLFGVTNSSFTNNVANNGTFNGFYVDPGSSGNTLTNNAAHGTTAGTGNYDMQDDSTGSGTLGTANTWHNNSCKTSLPAELCRQ